MRCAIMNSITALVASLALLGSASVSFPVRPSLSITNAAAREIAPFATEGKPYCYHYLEKIDFVGNDMGAVQMPLEDCPYKCALTPSCDTFTWTDYNGGTCWLKNNGGASKIVVNTAYKPTNRALSGWLLAMATTADSCPKLYYRFADLDWRGADMASKPSASDAECFSHCVFTPNCVWHTWTSFNGGTCWLKNKEGVAVAMPGAISGIIGDTFKTNVTFNE